jgi:periplasmic protein TonB
MAHTSILSQYPPEQGYFRLGTAGSFGLHMLVAGVILLVAFLTHVKTIEELMKESGSVATSGPAPEEPMEVVLVPDDTPPPPPVVNPDFVRQIEKPKPVVVPIPVPQPVKQIVAKAKPRYTAPRATGDGQTNTVSRLVVGTGGFPQPGYPVEAEMRHQAGTVLVSIQFDGAGRVADAEVVQSSGVSLLDSNTRSFIRSHWHDPSFAGKTVSVPITYHLAGI